MLARRCYDCYYWNEDSKERGACRRHAPAAQVLAADRPGAPETSAAWPVTRADDWCGEFHRLESR